MPRKKLRKDDFTEVADAFLRGKRIKPSPNLSEQFEKEAEEVRLCNARERGLESFYYFAVEVCGDVGLDAGFHGVACGFLQSGETEIPFEEFHRVAKIRDELPIATGLLNELSQVPAPAGRKRWAQELDGSFRGVYVAQRGTGRLKALYLPRGHIKTGLLEDFILWLQVRNIAKTGKPIRCAICCERQQLAKDILHGIRRKIEKNERLQQTYPELIPLCFLERTGSRPEDLTWESTAIELPGSQHMHEREPSISCYGVQTGITGCHFDRIFFDDIVTQKNIGTDIQIQKVRQFVEDSLFLLDPGGKVLDVGTRWHFADAHGAILDGTLIGIDSVSLCFATIDGEDSRPMYPYQDRRGRKYGFTREGIKLLVEGDKERGIEPISNERFSSQYRNQPIESRESLFPRDRWGFFDIEEHTKWIERTPHTRWCLCDPAIKKYPGQQTGDFAFACVIDCMVNGEWRILDGRHGRYTIDELLDALDSLNRKWQPNSLGIEEGQYEHTLKYAAEQRGLALPIFPIKGQMNRESKTMRCQRITGKQKAGHIKIPGNPALPLRDQYWDIPDWARTLIEEAARFPKGVYDDCIDTLGYGPDVIYPPLVEEVDKKELATLQKSADILDWIEETGERQVHPILGAIR